MAEPPTPASAAPSEIVRLAARAHEPDRYLAALLAPPERRDALLALAAFAGEIARIPITVEEPMMAALRLQWWRDALSTAPDLALRTGHPIADAVRDAIAAHGLPPPLLMDQIDAADDLLTPEGEPAFPIDDEAALDRHLRRTVGSSTALAVHVLGGDGTAPDVEEATLAAARAEGLTRILVELPAEIAARRVLIPLTRLTAAGIDRDALLRGRASAAVQSLLAEMRAEARRALALARRRVASLSASQRPAFAPLALVAPQLRLLGRPRHDPLREIVEPLPVLRIARIWWAVRAGI